MPRRPNICPVCGNELSEGQSVHEECAECEKEKLEREKINVQNTEIIERILGQERLSQDDFIDLAVAGEQSHRLIHLREEERVSRRKILNKYDTFLESGKDSHVIEGVVERLDDEVESTLRKLSDYAKQSIVDRRKEEGERLFSELDKMLCVATSAWRSGNLKKEKLLGIAKRVQDRIGELSPRLSELWQYAQDKIDIFLPDFDLPEIQNWVEELAELSSDRLLLEAGLARMAEKNIKEKRRGRD